ncbi:MAG: hypothetical protein D3904_14595 [Candidatus Electrothrix sp. EH2]|nr:hypothetical protein [Candidatus Electrothrix sp. EH2]
MLLTANLSQADVPPEQQPEVKHLIRFVQTSSCLIRRNGKTHSGTEAASHILEKYAYFRDKIKSAEDFIKYSASKSTMSGKYYTVLCAQQKPMRTKDWLLKELKSYREEREEMLLNRR